LSLCLQVITHYSLLLGQWLYGFGEGSPMFFFLEHYISLILNYHLKRIALSQIKATDLGSYLWLAFSYLNKSWGSEPMMLKSDLALSIWTKTKRNCYAKNRT
jgi:hypothetical protein